MGAVKKIADAVAGFFSEATRARQEVEKAELAVKEAQRLFDASPSQGAGENLMAKKRDLENAKLFVERAERLGAEEQRALELAANESKRTELQKLDAIADITAVGKDIAALVVAARPAFEALAQLDRDVLKRIRRAAEAAHQAARSRAQLDGRGVDRDRLGVILNALRAQENMHAVIAAENAKRDGTLDNLRWLARL